MTSAFGRVLVEQRAARGLSRSQLAEASGLSYPYVSQLETGIRKPSRTAAASLAHALGLHPLELEALIPAEGASPAPNLAGIRGAAPESVQELVEQLAAALDGLPPGDRLDALSALQKAVMERMLHGAMQ